jgi:hypothetical protein
LADETYVSMVEACRPLKHKRLNSQSKSFKIRHNSGELFFYVQVSPS